MRFIILLLCFIPTLRFYAQTPTQTVRGKVFDSETNFPLNAVKISIDANDGKLYRALSTTDGTWEIAKVPVGKHELSANYSFYESKSMNIEVVAEGIEEPFQHQFLHSVGCDFGQGYLYSRPVPVDQVSRLLEQGIERPA